MSLTLPRSLALPLALASLLGREGALAATSPAPSLAPLPHHPPRAKRVIYLFMAGGPSQIDLLDYKPTLEKLHNQELPASIRMGQRRSKRGWRRWASSCSTRRSPAAPPRPPRAR